MTRPIVARQIREGYEGQGSEDATGEMLQALKVLTGRDTDVAEWVGHRAREFRKLWGGTGQRLVEAALRVAKPLPPAIFQILVAGWKAIFLKELRAWRQSRQAAGDIPADIAA